MKFAFALLCGLLTFDAPSTLLAIEPTPLIIPTLTDPSDPSGFFFAAEQIMQGAKDRNLSDSEQQLAEFMFSIAFRFAKGPAAQEAGKSLYDLFSSQARYMEAAQIAREWIQEFGTDWGMYRDLYDALCARNDFQSALNLVPEIAKALPSLAKSRATELAWMEYSARAALQDYSWAAGGPPYIKSTYPDSYVAKIFRLYASWSGAPQDLAALALFRAAAIEKNYAEAVTAAIPILQSFTAPTTPRAWLSELGRSLYGAGAWQQGLAFFSAALGLSELSGGSPAVADMSVSPATPTLPTLDRARIPSENAWVMAFYLARMYQGIKDSQTAASIYIELVPLAFSSGDSDSALWYWLDITMTTIAETDSLLGDLGQDDTNAIHAKRALEISALTQAAALWKKPSFFEDIVGDYMRRLLREGAWDDVVRLCALMSLKLTTAMRGPLLYLSGRLIETGRASFDISSDSDFWRWLNPDAASIGAPLIGAASPGEAPTSAAPAPATTAAPPLATVNAAAIYYRALLREHNIEEHYRTLAAWRLGIDPPVLASVPTLGPDFDIESAFAQLFPSAQNPPVSDENLRDMLDFIGQSLDYGLESLAASQIAALSSFSTDTLMWLAMKFIQHNQYYPALRIGREALNRRTATKPELSYALLYPRAWPEHFAELTTPRNIAEPLAYAVIRSESLFNQRAVSRSGAMGLSQLLPGTAAETARGLKMPQFALFDPKDNLTIGFTYFGYMLERFNNDPTKAIAAYNAGPGRMAQWVRDWGALDDDILIETYPVEEPRQYTKNITANAITYGKLYYGIPAKDMLDFIYGVKPFPTAVVEPSSAAAPSTPSAPAPTAPSNSTPTMPAPIAPTPDATPAIPAPQAPAPAISAPNTVPPAPTSSTP